ncbi:MAG: xanthine dehydrogenase family protein molybdopterin-binding subunit [Chloroflexota bacterium]|nr:xanthine dehydrogenase family protein molybdopterin-binding subunit [Chloroflexota bacterium]
MATGAEQAKHSIVGTSPVRLDALEKVTGEAQFCTDVKLPGMLYAKVLRSPLPHARIVSLDTSKAEALPGVRVVANGKDAPDKRYGGYLHDQHALCKNVVRHVGDGVAAVAADTLEIAERAIELIDVKYEELPAVFDVAQSWSTSPPAVVHPDLFKYEKFVAQGLYIKQDRDRPNVAHHQQVRHGDVEQGFREADIILEDKFSIPRIQHVPFEPHICIIKAERNGNLTIWSGRQSIYRVKGHFCSAFNLPPSKVRVISSYYIGGGFGNKAMLRAEPIIALLAMKAVGRPIRYVFTREEMYTAGGTRIAMEVMVKDGVKKDGEIVAREVRVLLNIGAYADSGVMVCRNCTFGCIGTYRIPNLKIDSYAVYTNEPLTTPFRGFGASQPIFAIESHMDMLAEKLGLDPVEVRRKNVLREGDVNGSGEITHSAGIKECLDKVAEGLEWGKKSTPPPGPWRVGKGLALGNKYSTAPSSAMATVRMLEDGVVVIKHSADEMGQGVNTAMAQIAAEELGVSWDKVRVEWGDTNSTPYFPQGSTSQRTVYYLGNAVYLACQDAKRQLFELAAPMLKASQDDLLLKEGRIVVKSAPARSIRVTDIFTADRPIGPGQFGEYVEKYGEILGRGMFVQRYAPENPETGQIDPELAKKGMRLVASYGHACQGAEVAVNTETGEVKLLRLAAASDMGFPISPKMCEQQMEGGLVMGIGSALWEEVKMEAGKVLNPNLRDYKIPDAVNLPGNDRFKSFLAPSPHKDGPYGAKGCGEVQMTPSAAVIANAVYNAVGVRIKSLPLTREKVLKALKEQG